MGLPWPRLLSIVLMSGIALNMITTMLLPSTPSPSGKLESLSINRQSSLRNADRVDPQPNSLEDRSEDRGTHLFHFDAITAL